MIRMDVLFSSKYDAKSLFFRFMELFLCKKIIVMRPIYTWQHPTWAEFTWNNSRLINILSEVRHLEGKIQGLMSGF